MPFTAFVPVAGNTPLPLPVASGGTGAATAPGGLANLGGLVKQAATAVAGYTLVNGTGAVISWTPPNDGQLHRAVVMATIDVTSAETGGQMNVGFNSPDGGVLSTPLFAGGLGTGVRINQVDSAYVVEAGVAVTVTQATALTLGAAVMWAEIWGS